MPERSMRSTSKPSCAHFRAIFTYRRCGPTRFTEPALVMRMGGRPGFARAGSAGVRMPNSGCSSPRRTPRGGKDIHPRELVGERAGQQQPERLLSIGSRRKGRSHLRLDVEVELVQLRDLVDELRSRNPGAPEHERVDIASLSRVEE